METKRLSKNLKDLIVKFQNLNFLTSVKNWWPQLTWKLNEAISLKIWFESKEMKINDIFYRFTSKAYSAAILSINFHLYQLKVPKKLTQIFSIFKYFSLIQDATEKNYVPGKHSRHDRKYMVSKEKSILGPYIPMFKSRKSREI